MEACPGLPEDDVLLTAVRLFQTSRVRHAVFEYTPAQFVGRGTNYSSFLPRLYAMGARNCYAAHRRRSQFFAIPHPAVAAGILDRFYMVNKRIRMQTDIYCSFCSDELFPDAPVWTEYTKLRTWLAETVAENVVK